MLPALRCTLSLGPTLIMQVAKCGLQKSTVSVASGSRLVWELTSWRYATPPAPHCTLLSLDPYAIHACRQMRSPKVHDEWGFEIPTSM